MATPANPYVFAFNGWLFGGVDGGGVQVLSVDGLEDLPSLRTQDEGRGYQDGMFTGRDFLNGRTITMTLQVMGANAGAATDFQTYIQQVKKYLISQTSGTGVLQIYLPSRGVQRLNARVRQRAIRIDPNYTYGRAEAVVQFFCPDPRIYNDTITSQNFNPVGGGVRSYSKTYSFTYSGGSGGVSSASVTNQGNYTTFPTFTLTGACANPIITNVTTGQFLAVNTSLSATDTLIIDTDLRTIMLNGQAARNLLSNTSQWFGLAPQTPTTINYSVASGAGSCTLAFRDAYI